MQKLLRHIVILAGIAYGSAAHATPINDPVCQSLRVSTAAMGGEWRWQIAGKEDGRRGTYYPCEILGLIRDQARQMCIDNNGTVRVGPNVLVSVPANSTRDEIELMCESWSRTMRIEILFRRDPNDSFTSMYF